MKPPKVYWKGSKPRLGDGTHRKGNKPDSGRPRPAAGKPRTRGSYGQAPDAKGALSSGTTVDRLLCQMVGGAGTFLCQLVAYYKILLKNQPPPPLSPAIGPEEILKKDLREPLQLLYQAPNAKGSSPSVLLPLLERVLRRVRDSRDLSLALAELYRKGLICFQALREHREDARELTSYWLTLMSKELPWLFK